jgi:hypothetical protein
VVDDHGAVWEPPAGLDVDHCDVRDRKRRLRSRWLPAERKRHCAQGREEQESKAHESEI